MLTEPVSKATGSKFWSEFGLVMPPGQDTWSPAGFRFAEQVRIKLGADSDEAVASFELWMAPCLADHVALSAWGAQLVAAVMVALRDPAYQPLAEELQARKGPWFDMPDTILEGVDSQLQLRREEDGSVKLVAELNDYQPCTGCGLFNPLSDRKCERCKAPLTRAKSIKLPEPPEGEKPTKAWWPFKKK